MGYLVIFIATFGMRKDLPLSDSGLSTLSKQVGIFPGFTERLVEARKRLGLTQKEMAAHLAISLNTYLRSESGRRAMDIVQVARLAELGVDTGWLLTGMNGFAERRRDTFAHLDGELMGQIIDGLVTMTAEENQRLTPIDQGRIATEIYQSLATIEDDAERRGALRYALEIRRRDIHRAGTGDTSSKHRA
jgi:transcriptional regulator with XRE-family HTH domain